MRFIHRPRYDFVDTPRKRSAFFAKQRRERESLPLFSDQIAEEQAKRPDVDEVMSERAQKWFEFEQKDRLYHAKKWREGRAKLFAYGDNIRAAIRAIWKECPYPADPSYFLTFLHMIETDRIDIESPPWRYTEEQRAAANATFQAYLARKASEVIA